jgi:hypothetical protein
VCVNTGGTITIFSVSGVGIGNLQGTIPAGINTAGKIAGWCGDPSGGAHGFVRSAAGVITSLSRDGDGAGEEPIAIANAFHGLSGLRQERQRQSA